MTKIREYEGRGIVVRYDASRCIHAAKCVAGLPEVFDAERRPWIDAGAASPEDVTRVVADCPSGALQFERTDGGPQEAIPETNSVHIEKDGPIYLSGNITLVDHEGGTLLQDTRVALCRCGASQSKPFCDNSHQRVGFKSEEG